MTKDFKNKNLQNASLTDKDLSHATFLKADLRGADFSGSDLTGADFAGAKIGITPMNKVWIFIVALAISALSGYFAMLAGATIQQMVQSDEPNVRVAGIISLIVILLFVVFSVWRGIGNATRNLVLPVLGLSLAIYIAMTITGAGTGHGAIYLATSLILVVIMFVVGTIARVTAGSLSNILFFVVAIFGSVVGRSVGGGLGTVIMAIACVQISKRAVKGAPGFDTLRRIANFVTRKFGTSFRHAKMGFAQFDAKSICNADFSGTDVSFINWGKTKRINCVDGEAQPLRRNRCRIPR
jgi:hypothetical protein